ncbi:MAG: hypothetical protein ACF8LL_15095 [Phycisphaerales bacterium]
MTAVVKAYRFKDAECPVCGPNGMLLAMRLNQSDLYVSCDECHTSYEHPEDAINLTHSLLLIELDSYESVDCATLEHLIAAGWGDYNWEPTIYDPNYITPKRQKLIDEKRTPRQSQTLLSRCWRRLTHKGQNND